ncbi:MAG: hypothetical protein QM759_07200 [Terricaulis sp.]
MQHRQQSSAHGRSLRAGDEITIRPAAEIAATLDAHGARDGLPFMPEMLPACGKSFRVLKVAHKTCDPTGESNLRSTNVEGAVHVQARCDGSAHGGCQARCLFFFHPDWVAPASGAAAKPEDAALPPAVAEMLTRETLAAHSTPEKVRYRCQATEIKRYTTAISSLEPTQYVRDLTTGNVGIGDYVKYGIRGAVIATRRAILSKGVRDFFKKLLHPGAARDTQIAEKLFAETPKLNLQAGELVRVKPAAEIVATLDENGKHLGLTFDPDMALRAGQTFRVSHRVEKLIDEHTGRMLRIKKDSIVLEGVSCMGTHHCNRLFCPRGAQQFWREEWLERVTEAQRG